MKKKTLQEHSKNYTTHIKPYEEFKKAEDKKGIILSFLKKEVKNKIVLDIGCGEGTDAKILAPLSKHYYALDSSYEQLKKARNKCKNIKNIIFLHSSGENINLPKEKVDLVICAWVISVVNSYKRKLKILKEAERVLKSSGKIILIENDWHGEFEKIRQHPKRTKNFNEWLIKRGFKILKKINTYFKFPSYKIANQVFEDIWGKRVSNKIKSNKVEHKIVIFTKSK